MLKLFIGCIKMKYLNWTSLKCLQLLIKKITILDPWDPTIHCINVVKIQAHRSATVSQSYIKP